MLMSDGSAWSTCVKASSPPAEAPIPTIRKDSSRFRSSTRAFTPFRVADFTGREPCFPPRASACLFLTGLRSASFWANRQTLEDNSRRRLGPAEYKGTSPLLVQWRFKEQRVFYPPPYTLQEMG